MRAQRAMLALLAAAGVWSWDMQCEAANKAAVRICGRHLSELMSRVCKAYYSPAWDNPIGKAPPAGVRRRRDLGIATECCIYGCTLEQLTKYCQEPTKTTDSSLEELEAHLIADRSAEAGTGPLDGQQPQPPAVVGGTGEVGRSRSRGYGRARGRRGRCWCRRRRRSGRRRPSLMGNTQDPVKNAAHAAPLVGTVSPLFTWGRTLHADVRAADLDRYGYVAVVPRP